MDSRLFLNTSCSSIPLCGNNLTNNHNANQTSSSSSRTRNVSSSNANNNNMRTQRDRNDGLRTDDCCHKTLLKKYVILCLICGGLSVLVGCLFIVIYFLFRSYTSSLQYFETIPTYIPSLMLILNGLIVMCLARRKSRYIYLIKLAGCFCIISALICVVITITTTVVHMNRLQAMHDCVYTSKSKTCTCTSTTTNSGTTDTLESNGSNFTFHNITKCDVIQGSLYACLRALFGLSVFGILICIFSSMLVYQLLSHEKKKMYMEQLEIRRRFQQQNRRLQQHLPFPPLAPPPHSSLHQHSLRHNALCNCLDDSFYPLGWPPPPPPPWDVLDLRSSQFRSFQEEDSPSNTNNNNDTLESDRVHSWTNWLNWPWNNSSNTSTSRNNNNSNARGNDGWFSRLFRRRNSDTNRINNNLLQWRPMNGPNVLPPPHVFIPRMNSNGLTTLSVHPFRYRNNNSSHPYNIRGRTIHGISGSNRRTRSNDGIFHHLHYPGPGYPSHIIPPPSVFALWGPPPPYTCSQPTSLERLNMNNNERQSIGNRRESNVQSNHSNSESKMSTPISERRMHCNAFTSQGITLTIGGNDNTIDPNSKSSCIVEVHVPYDGQNNDDLNENLMLSSYQKVSHENSFNTMPHIKKTEHIPSFNPFKSMSNIPINIANGLNKEFSNQIDAQATIISTEYPKFTTIQNVYCSKTPLQSFSSTSSSTTEMKSQQNSKTQSSMTETTTNCTTDTFANRQTSSSSNFQISYPSDYKSTLIVGNTNTRSNPITDKTDIKNSFQQQKTSTKINYAHSMPNLTFCVPQSSTPSHSSYSVTCSQSSDLHRIPSSGNTSTSQDFEDFELELDNEPIKFAVEIPPDSNSQPNIKPSNNSVSSSTISSTPEILQPPTPFNTKLESSSSISVPSLDREHNKPDNIIITIKSIQV